MDSLLDQCGVAVVLVLAEGRPYPGSSKWTQPQSSTAPGSNSPSQCWRKTWTRHPHLPWPATGPPCNPTLTRTRPLRVLLVHLAPVDRRRQNRATSGIPQPSVAVLQSVRGATPLNRPPRPHRPCRSVQPAARWAPEWGRPPPPSPPLRLQAAMGEATGGRWRNRATRLATPGRQLPTKSTPNRRDTALALQTWTTTGEPRPQDLPRTARPTRVARRETERGSGGVVTHQPLRRSRR